MVTIHIYETDDLNDNTTLCGQSIIPVAYNSRNAVQICAVCNRVLRIRMRVRMETMGTD